MLLLGDADIMASGMGFALAGLRRATAEGTAVAEAGTGMVEAFRSALTDENEPAYRIAIEPGFDFLSQEYRGFYDGRRGSPFQAPLWLHMLHHRLAPVLGALQRTVTIRDPADGRLMAVLPMVLQRIAGVVIAQPADFGVSDCNRIVADPHGLALLARNPAFRHDLRAALGEADLVMFRKIRSDDFDLSLLLDGGRTGMGENASYDIETGIDFDHWRLHVLRRQFTKELGRLQRRTERQHGSYEHRPIRSESEIREAFDFLRETLVTRGRAGLLANSLFFRFYRDYAIAGAGSGEATTYASYIAGKPAAVLFGLSGDGGFHAVLIGCSTGTHERNSTGIQIVYRVAQMRMAEGHRSFAMGLGDTGYKTHFRPKVTPMHNFTLPLSPVGSAVALIYHRSKRLKNMLKGMIPNVH